MCTIKYFLSIRNQFKCIAIPVLAKSILLNICFYVYIGCVLDTYTESANSISSKIVYLHKLIDFYWFIYEKQIMC